MSEAEAPLPAEQVDVIPTPPPFEPLTEPKIKELLEKKRAELAEHSNAHNQFAQQVQAQIEASMKRAIQMEGAILLLESFLPKPPPPNGATPDA